MWEEKTRGIKRIQNTKLLGGIAMTEYEKYLLDELDRVKKENHSLEVELVNAKQTVMKVGRESAELRRKNMELSEYINFLNSKEEL